MITIKFWTCKIWGEKCPGVLIIELKRLRYSTLSFINDIFWRNITISSTLAEPSSVESQEREQNIHCYASIVKVCWHRPATRDTQSTFKFQHFAYCSGVGLHFRLYALHTTQFQVSYILNHSVTSGGDHWKYLTACLNLVIFIWQFLRYTMTTNSLDRYYNYFQEPLSHSFELHL